MCNGCSACYGCEMLKYSEGVACVLCGCVKWKSQIVPDSHFLCYSRTSQKSVVINLSFSCMCVRLLRLFLTSFPVASESVPDGLQTPPDTFILS